MLRFRSPLVVAAWAICLGLVPMPGRAAPHSARATVAAETILAQAQPNAAYDRLMAEGYVAAQNRDYAIALEKFQQALTERPGDTYAQQAAENMAGFLARNQKQQQSSLFFGF
ncbi:MAG: hypothetical protein HC890_03110 [Chloroflexaceae bacterium]|nr:hypothetical protein [Chloroflexaceae bacterium]